MAAKTIQSSFDRMTGDKKQGGEITYGRYIFRGGKVFGFDGREIAKPFLTAGEAQAQQQSMQSQSTSQFSGTPPKGAGGMISSPATGPRIGGTSVNISGGGGGGGGGFSQIQNPLIRDAARMMEFNQWMYGTPYSPSEQQQRAASAMAIAEGKRFQDFARGRGDLNDPVSAARITGEWSRQEAKRNQEIQGARIAGQYGYGSKQYGDWQAGQRAVYDPRRD